MSRLITCLWFANNNGEEAVEYYMELLTRLQGNIVLY